VGSENNMAGTLTRFDGITRILDGILAMSVVAQLTLSALMRAPNAPGPGTFDWRREAFEIHARLGLWVGAICALDWIRSISPPPRGLRPAVVGSPRIAPPSCCVSPYRFPLRDCFTRVLASAADAGRSPGKGPLIGR